MFIFVLKFQASDWKAYVLIRNPINFPVELAIAPPWIEQIEKFLQFAGVFWAKVRFVWLHFYLWDVKESMFFLRFHL